ncbi:MAG: insulinase family protein [Rikenellaceae bacterium]|jgi:zinc protease|nr:insulinase family protein [Rikenellaceae bacterium]
MKTHTPILRNIIPLFTLIFCSLTVGAQPMAQLPVDPQVRTGKLGNGLTYYIRHNELPKAQAEFYIAQRVGSMQEEENQRGLAHFLEHMAFNGTPHFPGKSLTEYLESVGAKFGYNINAYTSFDETVYTLMNIPVTRQAIVDSALLVLYDWSCGIALEDTEIDAERGVIHEEWRTGQSAQMRIFNQVLPVIFAGSRYGHRLPIGEMEVVDNFPYQDIRDYYHKWYRPDLQAIVVIGDVDVDYVEAKIKELFSTIPLATDRAERVYFEVPDNAEPIVALATDKELTNVRTSVFYKHPPLAVETRNTPLFYVQNYMDAVIGSMMDARLEELVQQADPPYLAAGVYNDQLLGVTATEEALTAVVISDETGIERAFRALLTELRRLDQHGFTAAEYNRARADFLNAVETSYNERAKQQNATYANEYTRSFLEGEPIPGVEAERALYQQLVPGLTVKDINQYVQELISDKRNIVFFMQGPDRADIAYPTAEEILALYDEVLKSNTAPYVDTVSDEPLIGQLPQPGTITGTAHDTVFDATVWTLSNGARVVVKPTPYKDDQVGMQAVSPGGYSLIDSRYDSTVGFLSSIGSLGGLGNFSATDLPKVLAGKNVSVSASVSELSESVGAGGAPRDLETLMQLVYLQFTAVRADREAFASWQNRQAAALRNMDAEPMFAYQDSLDQTLYDRNPRRRNPTAAEIEALDYTAALELFRARFADASDFTFLFVGNVDTATLRPLVEQYIASLPATHSRERAGEPILPVRGRKTNFFEKTVESPKVTMTYIFSDRIEPNLKNSVLMDALWQVLFSRYFETLREDEGGTYSPQVSGSISPARGREVIVVSIETNAEQYERLGQLIVEEIEKLAAEGPSEADFQKIREYMLKTEAENRQQNGYWMQQLNTYYLNGQDHLSGYFETVNAMTPQEIRDFANQLLQAGNVVNVTMNGVSLK